MTAERPDCRMRRLRANAGRISGVKVDLLGPVEVRDGAGCLAEVSGARLRALLVLLALRPGQVVPAGYLIDELWESRPRLAPPTRCRRWSPGCGARSPTTCSPPGPAGTSSRWTVTCIDVFRFERLAERGRALLAAGDPAAAAAALREALELWRGPALADAGESEIGPGGAGPAGRAAAGRDRGQDGRGAAARVAGDRSPAGGRPRGTAGRPSAARDAGRAADARAGGRGRRGAALAVYEQVRERLADELGADPSAELAALHLEILRAGEDAGAACCGHQGRRYRRGVADESAGGADQLRRAGSGSGAGRRRCCASIGWSR